MPEEEKKDKQDRMIELLEDMLKWIKVTSIPQVKKLLLDTLPSDKEKIAYHFSDGERNRQEVAKFAGVSTGTISNWWKIWVRVGIAESIGVKGGERAKRIFSLEDFGIETPPPKETKPEKMEAEARIETIIQEKSTQGENKEERT